MRSEGISTLPMRSYAGPVPAGEANPVINHNLNTEDIVSVNLIGDPGDGIKRGGYLVGWEILGPNQIRLGLAKPHEVAYRVVVAG